MNMKSSNTKQYNHVYASELKRLAAMPAYLFNCERGW